MDGTSFLLSSQIADFDHFYLANVLTYAARSPTDTYPTSRADLEDRNRTDRRGDSSDDQGLSPFKFKQIESNWVYRASENHSVSLEFSPDASGRIPLTKVGGKRVNPIHYSVAADRRAFSILYLLDDDRYGEVLQSLTFTSAEGVTKEPLQLDEEYQYLFGPGVGVLWSGDIEVTLCGPIDAAERVAMQSSIARWTQGGRVGKRSIQVLSPQEWFPFSDLNQHCLMIVDDYLFESQNLSAITGLTTVRVDLIEARLIDADVMISKRGLQKIYGEQWASRLVQTVTHEMGHFLGLGHNFEKGQNGLPKQLSIMSYEDWIDTVRDYDRDAVEAAYGADYLGLPEYQECLLKDELSQDSGKVEEIRQYLRSSRGDEYRDRQVSCRTLGRFLLNASQEGIGA